MKKTSFNLFLVLCAVGYVWVFYNYIVQTSPPTVCYIKNLTDYPCPSCGVTRAINSLLNGEIIISFFQNPLGLILFFPMIILPIWFLIDLFKRKASLYQSYLKFEIFAQKKIFYIPCIILLIINWIWNILKGY